MTTLGTMVGFGIVFLIVAVVVSAVLGAGLAVLGPALARRGVGFERRVIELVVAAPVVTAAIVVGALIVHSAVADDHCAAHDHHAHLCVSHGGAWLERPWAVAIGAATLIVVLGRAVVLGAGLWRGRGRVRALARMARPVGDVRLVESRRVFCFVAGLGRPAIYVSTAAWTGLPAEEREAMLAHERGHVEGGDVRRRLLVDLASIVSAPLAPGFLAGRWHDANERLRDRQAAQVTTPDAVAGALVHMVRLGAAQVAGLSFEARSSALAKRVRSVLVDAPQDVVAAGWLDAAAVTCAVTFAITAVVLADPLHHALETLLG